VNPAGAFPGLSRIGPVFCFRHRPGGSIRAGFRSMILLRIFTGAILFPPLRAVIALSAMTQIWCGASSKISA
jgi:hypothetical protein